MSVPMTPSIKAGNIVIAVAGAGLSGLCLAQSLVSAGFDVHVYERDPSADARRQGYRITVDSHGMDALRQCLPPRLFELFIATAGEPKGCFRYLTHELREVFTLRFPDEANDAEPRRGRQADRLTLRTILLSGLESRVHFGNAAARVHAEPDGATLIFEDGSSVRAAIVVGADGVNSRLREQLLPECASIDLGSIAICGRTPLVQDGRSLVPRTLEHTGVLAAGAPGRAFFFTTMHFHEPPRQAFARLAPDQFPPFGDDYVMWAIVRRTAEWPSDAVSASGAVLLQLASDAAREFHPVLRRFVANADVDATLAVPIRAATRPSQWAPSRATLMGDAVHAMPPFGAHGGNTALRDAALLSAKLCEAALRGEPLVGALDAYQKEMLDYAFAAVDSATSSMNRLNSRNPLVRWFMLRALPWYHSRRSDRLVVEAE
jgi:2-polyprenyl-6-methoxyphenol hydroxylase-like FAD-dependent oxidoreductase